MECERKQRAFSRLSPGALHNEKKCPVRLRGKSEETDVLRIELSVCSRL